MDQAHLDLIEDRDIRRAVSEYASLVSDGRIASPGKFEGEPLETVYFYQHMMNGSGEDQYVDCGHEGDCDCESELACTVFDIQAGDAEIFPSLETHVGEYFHLREDSQGFVYGWTSKSRED